MKIVARTKDHRGFYRGDSVLWENSKEWSHERKGTTSDFQDGSELVSLMCHRTLWRVLPVTGLVSFLYAFTPCLFCFKE